MASRAHGAISLTTEFKIDSYMAVVACRWISDRAVAGCPAALFPARTAHPTQCRIGSVAAPGDRARRCSALVFGTLSRNF